MPTPVPGLAASAGPPAQWVLQVPLPLGFSGPAAHCAAGVPAAGQRHDLGRAEGEPSDSMLLHA